MSHYADLKTFDGLDNRREVMILLERLESDYARAQFLRSLLPASTNGFARAPVSTEGPCDCVSAYLMFISICNELGVPVTDAMGKLERAVRRRKWARGGKTYG